MWLYTIDHFEKNILSETKFKKKYKLKHKKTCILFHGPQYNIKNFTRYFT